MADLRPQYNEEVVGHGHPTKADVTNRAWNVEHAEDGTHKVLPGESGIIMLFGKTAAPTGWTKKTDWQDNAMLCYATGAIVNGGAVNPQSAHAHGLGTLAGPNHTHTGPSHTHLLVDYGDNIPNRDIGDPIGRQVTGPDAGRLVGIGGVGIISFNYVQYITNAAGTGATGADGTGAITGAMVNNTAPHYQEVIAAQKD